MTIVEYILKNYVMLFELVGLFITLLISSFIPKQVKKLTRITIISLVVAMVVYILENWTQTFETLSIWRPILTAFKYCSFTIILYLITLIVSSAINPLSKKVKILLVIPIAICVPIFFTSQWTGIVCVFTDDNHYNGGLVPSLPYIVFALYLVFFVVYNIISLRKFSLKSRIIVLFFSLASFLGVALFVIFDITDNYFPIFTSSIVFYYLFLYIHMAGIDPLTGLQNRQNYYNDLEEKRDRITAVVSIDMNELKYLNDNYGHSAGDEALKVVARVLLENAGPNSVVYRIGGDEFIIFYSQTPEKIVIRNIDNIKDGLRKTRYSCAIGYAMNYNASNLEDVVKSADNEMYENKAIMKNGVKEIKHL